MNHAAVQIDALHRGLDETRRPQVGADRQGAVTRVERPGADFKQQRRQYDEVVATDQDDLDIWPAAAQPLQVTGRQTPPEAAAKDDDPGLASSPATRVVRRERIHV